MCWGCGAVVPIVDPLADLLGLDRGKYWTNVAGTYFYDLILTLQQPWGEMNTPLIREIRALFPTMISLPEARLLASQISTDRKGHGIFLVGLDPDAVEDRLSNLYCTDASDLTLFKAVDPGWIDLFIGTKRTKPINAFKRPDLLDLRFYKPDAVKLL